MYDSGVSSFLKGSFFRFEPLRLEKTKLAAVENFEINRKGGHGQGQANIGKSLIKFASFYLK